MASHKLLLPLHLLVMMLVGTYLKADESMAPARVLIPKQSGDLKFQSFNNRDGLSQNSVLAITQDHQGFMWFGTRDGLNRFDGYTFKVYYAQMGNPTALANNYVRALLSDPDGSVWVGTQNGGLSRYNPDTDQFTSISSRSPTSLRLPGDYVACLLFDHDGGLLIGTNRGLVKLAKNRQTIHPIDLSHEHAQGPPFVTAVALTADGTTWIGTRTGLIRRSAQGNNTFFSLFADSTQPAPRVSEVIHDSRGRLWVATRQGAFRFEEETETFTHFRPEKNNPHSLSHDEIFKVFSAPQGDLWFGTQDGLNRFDMEKEQFEAYFQRNYLPDSLSSNEIWSLFTDRQGNLWVGTYNGGVSMYAPLRQRFTHFQHDPENEDSLGGREVWSIFVDQQRRIWVGTYDGGLSRYHPETNRFSHHSHQPGVAGSLSDTSIWAINQDQEGALWVGTRAGGVNVGTPEQGFRHYRHDPKDPQTLPHNRIYQILRDGEARMWVATRDGLARFQKDKNNFLTFRHDPKRINSVANNRIYNLYIDRDKRVWAATLNGLSLYNNDETGFTNFYSQPGQPHSLSSNVVSTMYHDTEGNFWVGTYQGGLNKWPAAYFNQKEAHFQYFGHNEGMPSETIYALTGDRQGRLWMSTNQGLASFDPRTERFRSYTMAEGTQDKEFKNGFFHDTQTDTIFFGGINGFNAFQPEHLPQNTFIPPIVISQLSVTRFTEKTTLPLNRERQLEFDYHDQALNVELAALDYTDPKRNRYAYQLEGLHDETIELGTQRRLSFANLPSGRYTLRLFGANNDGHWNETGTSLSITIRPPVWASREAIAGYLLLALGLVFWLWRYQIRRIEDQAQIESLKQTDQAKSMFIANVSHELRTPMNGVIGMADILSRMKLPAQAGEYVTIIRNSGETLLAVINDILDLSKIDADKMILETIPFRLRAECDGLIDLFAAQTADKSLTLRQWIEPDVPDHLMGDPIRLRQILTNIVGNAVKFTQTGGIELRVRQQEIGTNQCRLFFEIHDSGIGISKDRLDLLFKPFQQVDSSTTRKFGGTGLGLTISKRLVEMMGGGVSVQSKPNVGSTFQFDAVFDLPAANTEPEPPPAKPWILLWEEDPRDREPATAMLEFLGYGVQHIHQVGPDGVPQLPEENTDDIHRLWWGLGSTQDRQTRAWQSILKKIEPRYPVVFCGVHDPRGDDPPSWATFNPRPLRFRNTASILEHSPANPDQGEEETPTLNHHHGYHLLLVEDNLINQKVAMRMLEQLGLTCDLAGDGEQALAACAAKTYDLILMDCQMPVMDGLEATRRLRARYGSTAPTIVALTANASQEDRAACLAAGMDDFLTKPLKRSNLETVLERRLPTEENRALSAGTP